MLLCLEGSSIAAQGEKPGILGDVRTGWIRRCKAAVYSCISAISLDKTK